MVKNQLAKISWKRLLGFLATLGVVAVLNWHGTLPGVSFVSAMAIAAGIFIAPDVLKVIGNLKK